MRILVVNSNTLQSVTDMVAAEARRAAGPDTEIVAVTAPFGAPGIDTRADAVVAAQATLAAFADHADGVDAGVVACFSDPGLAAARQLMPFPVVGIAEAAFFTACMLGSRFSVVTLGRTSMTPVIAELAAAYGVGGRLASVRALEIRIQDAARDQSALRDDIAALIDQAVDDDGAEAIVLGGAALAGLRADLQDNAEVPLLDGVDCAVRQAELLASLGLAKPVTGSYASPPAKAMTGLTPALTAAFLKDG